MRELKFRAWFKNENQLIYFDFSDIDNGVITYPCPKLRFIDESIVEQYTGLQDKNEREIYEGDVLREVVSQAGREQNYVVEMPDIYYMQENGNYECDMEVIGNIHENPELLNANP